MLVTLHDGESRTLLLSNRRGGYITTGEELAHRRSNIQKVRRPTCHVKGLNV